MTSQADPRVQAFRQWVRLHPRAGIYLCRAHRAGKFDEAFWELFEIAQRGGYRVSLMEPPPARH